ncbi:alpha-L-fucosidase [Nonomuraea thailandensis]|uniref:alpha-L-fucosidase n=1 Tax=Nonomuraea thailandensis TaxID=1188745 RepID=A0A9X2GML7_9ACTN|nr:alpha-L-fucosidase [Nonomuraea thailandensis]MCP2360379.1 alpha-L-fucosidase [Nonomuraea thailandensis]
MTPFQPTWESLRTHRIPQWFGEAKFGIWSHWGPQSVARSGDWYARHLYGMQPWSEPWERKRAGRQHAHHRAHFQGGAKDLFRHWRAERFDPDELVDLYVSSGARYFVALATHCDNFDLWNSGQHGWNAARVGPGRDIVAAWERAARAAGLPFGLSFHQNWTWRWLDVAHGRDPETGEPYDGALTKGDGAGTWWEGLDPAELYPERHEPGARPPVREAERFYARVREALDRYRPDLVYLDDGRLPFDEGSVVESQPVSTAGLDLLAHYYNTCDTGGLVTIKDVPDLDRTAVLLDCERRQLDEAQPHPWQFDTSDGEWFDCSDDDPMFHPRKTAQQIIHTLIDVVSKNGCLLLNIPQHADGTVDARARELLAEVGAWLRTCGEGVYGTTPWLRAAEGTTGLGGVKGYEGYNEADRAYRPTDVRFTRRGDTLYATLLAWPEDRTATITSLGATAGLLTRPPAAVELLGHGPVPWRQSGRALHADLPPRPPTRAAHMLKITGASW